MNKERVWKDRGSKEMDRCPITTTCPLSKLIPVYNVNGTENDASAITDIANVILRYENHSEHTQLAITRLGKQSLILGYNC
jgi:hypothetical protein